MPTLLLVDDHADDRDMLLRRLVRQGKAGEALASGALAIAQQHCKARHTGVADVRRHIPLVRQEPDQHRLLP